MTATPADADRRRHPAGLFVLAGTETWERFSFYGVGSILVLYVDDTLLHPERAAHVAGLALLRRALEGVVGPLSPLALASQIFGLYTGLIYFTPVFGGWLADRFIGRRRAVLLGAAMMTAGHFAMTSDRLLLAAMTLLVIGCGFLKGNISAQVGALYARGEDEARAAGYAVFSMGINAGAVLGPLGVGLLAARLGWPAGFAAAGTMMAIGFTTYAAGYRLLPETARQGARERRALTPRERRIAGALLLVMAVTVFQSIAFFQNSNIGLVWIAGHVDLDVLGFRVPASWFNAIDPLASIVFVPPLLMLARHRRTAGRRADELGAIAAGAAVAAAANLVLVAASLGGGRVGIAAPILYDTLLGISFLLYWPTMLALVSRAAPAPINGMMVSSVFLTLFVAYTAIGTIGRLYEHGTPAAFWALNAGIAAAGCVAATALRHRLSGLLAG